MVHYIEPADLAEAEYDDLHPHTAPTVAAQQCGRGPAAYEVRCTDGNYEWRRPYHGELEVIMSTGRDRSGKPFEYRALFADAPTVAAQQCGLPEGLDATDMDMIRRGDMLGPALGARAASLIQSQAARIAELEAGLEPFATLKVRAAVPIEDHVGWTGCYSISVEQDSPPDLDIFHTARALLSKGGGDGDADARRRQEISAEGR